MKKSRFTYNKSGVNIKKADKFVNFISSIIKRSKKSVNFKNIGGFGAISNIPKNLKPENFWTFIFLKIFNNKTKKPLSKNT